MADKMKDVVISIPDRERSGHLGVFGTTRIGKTRLIENIVEQDIKKGYNVVDHRPEGRHRSLLQDRPGIRGSGKAR